MSIKLIDSILVKPILIVAVVLGFCYAHAVDLASLQKTYFASTKPGSWAKYEMTSTDAKGKTKVTRFTLGRLENEADRIWLEFRMEPQSEQKAKAITMKFLVDPEVPLEKNALSFMKFVERAIMQEDGGEAIEMPWDMMKGMFAGGMASVDYGGDVTPAGSETVNGKPCDKYKLTGDYDFKVAFVRSKGSYESELWLNESVPFARVKEVSVLKDEDGKVTRSEWLLLESGAAYKSRVKGPVKKLEVPSTLFPG